MSAAELKKELVSYIENTEDEGLLSLLKEDIVFYGKDTQPDVTDDLSEEQLSELKMLAEEDPMKDTITYAEFQKATEKWRMK